VCVSVCLSAAVHPHYCMDPDVTWNRGKGCPLVVHYWADLQLGHGLHCYGNITRTLVTSLRPSRDMTTECEWPSGRDLRALLAGDWRVTRGILKIACRIWEVGVAGSPVIDRRRWHSQHYCGGLDCGLPLMAFWQQNVNKMLASTCFYSLYA